MYKRGPDPVQHFLLPDTETGKYLAQQIVAGKLACNGTQRLMSQPQFLGK
jgi:hypothetical protein